MNKVRCLEVLNIPIKMLVKAGILHIKSLTKVDALQLLIILVMLNIPVVFATWDVVNGFKLSDTEIVNWTMGLLLPVVSHMAKTLTLVFRKRQVLSILEYLEFDIFNAHSEYLNRHVQQINMIFQPILRYLTIVMLISLSATLPFTINVKLIIPAPFETGKFDIFYKCAHFLWACYLAFTWVGFDMLFLGLFGLAVAQLNILIESLRNVGKNSNEDYQVVHYRFPSKAYATQPILQDCIILYGMIAQYVDKLNTLLSFPLFVQYTGGCLVICNAILHMTILGNASTSHIVTIIGYTSVTFAQMAAYHWLANEIIYKSDKIIESCYMSNWYELSITSQKFIILLMERAKRPMVLQLYNFIYISLGSLDVVLRWSYSVFALIKARYN